MEDEGKSGKDIERAGIREALQLLKAGEASAMVVAKLDRLSRSLPDFARLLEVSGKEGWRIVALDLNLYASTPTGKLVASIMASVAQWEREVIGLRTKEARAAAKAEGIDVGRRDGQDPAVVRRIRRWRKPGLTYRAMADRLNGDAVPVAGRRGHMASELSAASCKPMRPTHRAVTVPATDQNCLCDTPIYQLRMSNLGNTL